MPLFFSDAERDAFGAYRNAEPLASLYWATLNRATRRAEGPGLMDRAANQEWWHTCFDYVADGAVAYALKPSPALGAWIRDAATSMARRPREDWVGPWFRDHTSEPRQGHLETAHVSWAVSLALDLAGDAFSDAERDEVAAVLRETAIPLCRQYLDRQTNYMNWRCVLLAGLAMPAAVLGDRKAMDLAAAEWERMLDAWQPDGTYGESLQYSNYAAFAMMLAYEALVRADPGYAARLDPSRYARGAVWQAASLLYMKPLDGWGQEPRPRSANFNDSAAAFRPSGDWLMHVAVRCRESLPVEAGVARWLFETCYADAPGAGPHDMGSFGFYNVAGALSLTMYGLAPAPLSPEAAGIPEVAAFTNGDTLVRDGWDGKTVLATHGAPDGPLHCMNHRHADLNSFILVHGRERMLADPGHACYRNQLREIDRASQSHNTCCFLVPGRDGELEQKAQLATRRVEGGEVTPPLDLSMTRFLAESHGSVRVVGSEVAAAYGDPITLFERIWILCGSHALFVVDRIASSEPVRTVWNWVLNNRDGGLELKPVPPDRIVARRGRVGMKIFHVGPGRTGGWQGGPVYGHLHDCYHPLPDGLGAGGPGSAMIMRFIESDAATARTAVHAVAVDTYGAVAGWHLRTGEGETCALEAPGERWGLTVSDDGGRIAVNGSDTSLALTRSGAGAWAVAPA